MQAAQAYDGSVFSRLITWFSINFPAMRGRIWQLVYDALAVLNSKNEWTTMNYGYAPDDTDAAAVETLADTEAYCRNLYSKVVGYRDLSGQDVLEVGSGYGGGARHITLTHSPASYTGMDFAAGAVKSAKSQHGDVESLEFVHGNAMEMPFPDDSFDVVVNVESSHCYPSTQGFFDEVARVLRPDGLFCWTDIRHDGQWEEIDPALERAGLELVYAEDISTNVLASIDAISAVRMDAVHRYLPGFIAGMGKDFAGTEGSNIHTRLSDGRTRYMLRTARLPT